MLKSLNLPPLRLRRKPVSAQKANTDASLRVLRRRIATTLVGLNLVIAFVIVISLWSSRTVVRDHAAELVENIDHVLAMELGGTFSKIDLCLQRIVEESARQTAERGEIDSSKLQRFIDREADRLSGIVGVRIVNRMGDVVLASNEVITAPINVADRERFTILRDHKDAGLVVSTPELGRLSGQWIIAFARRLEAGDGSFAGEAHISVSTAQISQMFSRFKLGPRGVVSLWNDSPATIVRFPEVNHPGGVIALAPPPSKKLFDAIKTRTEQTAYRATSGTDGVARSYYFHRLSGMPLSVVVGVAEQDYLEPWRTEAWLFTGFYALFVTIAGAGGASFYSRAVTRLAADKQLQLSGLVYDNSAEGMIVLDEYGVILGVNRTFVDITGHPRSDLIGRNISKFPTLTGPPRTFLGILRGLKASGRWTGEVPCRKASGEPFVTRLSVSAFDDEKTGAWHVVALFSDVTEAVWRHANFDELTSLPNRRYFRLRLDEEITRARRAGLSLAVIFIDLDRFKEINDTLGHQTGDLLLKEAAARLRACVRASDIIARLGGDEFTVLLTDLRDREPVERAAAEIVKSFATPYDLAGEQRFVSASLGVTLYPADAADAGELLRQADLAMYEAKRAGRNNYLFFKPGMQKDILARAQVVSDLHRALEENQFELHYQPIVSLRTGRMDRAEALVRWRHPVRGLVAPMDFIGIAEETGFIPEIGEWVFREAARQLADWRNRLGATLSVSVNVSPTQFSFAPKRLQNYPDIAREFGLADGSLIVEITEGTLLDASESVTAILTRFREGGLPIALDDFGTGYSSLAYLKQFDINLLKIDRAFVRGIADQTSDLAICEAVIVMAHRLGMKVVAEGVETDAQRILLTKSRCDFGQGYLFAHAMPALAFEQAYLQGAREPMSTT